MLLETLKLFIMRILNSLFIVVLLSIVSLDSIAQFLDNGDFENWTFDTYYEDPNGFNTSNLNSYSYFGEGNVNKNEAAFEGMFAAHLITPSVDGVGFPGFLVLGDVDDEINAGIPYSSVPLSISMQVNYDIPTNDTAHVILVLLNNGINIGGTSGVITGNSAGNYVSYSLDVTFFDFIVPDELVFVMTSGDFENPLPGGEILVDNISFEYSVNGEDFPNGGFEEWTATGAEEPDEWFTSNFLTLLGDGPSVTKSDDAYFGDFAARIETMAFGSDEGEDTEYSAFLTDGPIGENGPSPDILLNEAPVSISGFYKYFPIEPEDLGACYFLLISDDGIGEFPDTIAEYIFPFEAASEYTAFSFDLNNSELNEVWPETPVFMFTGFSSTRITDSVYVPQPGSVLYLDQLAMEFLIGVQDISSSNFNTKLVPNPSENNLRIETELPNPTEYSIYSIDGRLLVHRAINSGTELSNIDVSSLAAGVFVVRVRNEEESITLRGLKQ